MALAALIKFTQGGTTDVAGRAVVGVAGAAVVASNGDNTGVTSWAWKILDVPEGSAVVEGTTGAASTFGFTPDVPGTYQVKLTINGISTLTDVRDFIVPETSGDYIPAFKSDDTTFNYGGQAKGFKTSVNRLLKKASAGATPTVFVNAVSGVRPALAALPLQTLIHKATGATTYPLPAAPTDLSIVDFERASVGTGAVTFDGNGRTIENGTTSGATFGPSASVISARLTYYLADNVWRFS